MLVLILISQLSVHFRTGGYDLLEKVENTKWKIPLIPSKTKYPLGNHPNNLMHGPFPSVVRLVFSLSSV